MLAIYKPLIEDVLETLQQKINTDYAATLFNLLAKTATKALEPEETLKLTQRYLDDDTTPLTLRT